MDLGIQGKTALVAASSQGLGKAVALQLAAEGVQVAICARNAATLEQARKEIETATNGAVKVLAIPADLSTRDGQQTVINESLRQFQSIDILVTNSGGPPAGLFEEHADAAWDAAYHQLLGSAVGLMRGVLPGMKAKGWGRIIAITSQAVKQPIESLVLSNSIRSSVAGLVRTLANEVGEYGITVNNLMPGFTNTKRLARLLENNPDMLDVNTIPLRRPGEPEEFGAAAAFLASQRASYITGVSLAVDGGWIKSLL